MTHVVKERLYVEIIIALLLVTLAMACKFIIAGSTTTGTDGRVAILLGPCERALILRAMREFVVGLQRIADALSRDDMQSVAKASRAHPWPALRCLAEMHCVPRELPAERRNAHVMLGCNEFTGTG